MNIFVTSFDPVQCAREHCLVHRNKMIVEYAQLMSTAQQFYGTYKHGLYKPTHVNHPSNRWLRQGVGNYGWLYAVWKELNMLYLQRNGVYHKSWDLAEALDIDAIVDPFFTPDMLAMPEQFKCKDIKTSYQDYLNSKFDEWRSRSKPIRVVFEHGNPTWRT